MYRAGLDDIEKWKFFTLPGLELLLPLSIQSVASHYTDWAISAPEVNLSRRQLHLLSIVNGLYVYFLGSRFEYWPGYRLLRSIPRFSSVSLGLYLENILK
jgi:hypothetical protein